ncbi:ribonuclease H1-like [Maniola jurtina]|uniref:ribonuclease H1-like n=1 Tax=Maniola jurtina TaxID=191418 RepID=UPI001E68B7B0|nr:ribonuclease H1-like [Maniola jurtina]XP_045761474.1 ribonuclease H1-like [Maniola jurtina]
MPYYAVAKGRSSGVYTSWSDCENQVKGFSGAQYKKFDSVSDAQAFISQRGGGSRGGSSFSSGSSYVPSVYGSSSNMSHSSRGRGFETDRDGFTQVYTDGACFSNGRDGAKAGWGVFWGDGHALNESAPVSGRATNNRGEIQGATRAIQQAIDQGLNKLTINTDSKFLIDSATKWMDGWKQNGWRLPSGEPVKNEADFRELARVKDKIQVKWNHVDAHKGIHGNEQADQLAKEGASKYK